MIERLAYFAFAALALAIGAALLTGSAASNTVPVSSGGLHSDVPVPNDLKPPECAGIVVTSLVTGTGAFAGTAGNDLILGSAAADTITGNAGDDCVLGGAGDDDLAAGFRDGTGGGNDVLNAGAGTDRCRGEGGAGTYISCDEIAVSLLGGWVVGTEHPAEPGQGRLLLFVGMSENNPSRTLNGVTYGGQALSQVTTVSSAGGTAVTIELWMLDEAGIAAAAGSTLVPAWSGAVASVDYASAFFGDVNQVAPTGATSTNVGNNGSPLTSGAVANSWGDVVVYGVATGNAISFTADNGFVEGTDATTGSSAMQTAWKLAVGVDETPSATPSGVAGRWAMAAVTIASTTTP